MQHTSGHTQHATRRAVLPLDDLVCRCVQRWDGAPAIVFGINPDNGQFFVGTKSVFNKRRPKINYSPEDIDKNHKGAVADILRLCFRHLPRYHRIIQCDWIGVGGGSVYQPNTIAYHFPSPVYSRIIVAPHTEYTELSPNAEAKMGVKLPSSDAVSYTHLTLPTKRIV